MWKTRSMRRSVLFLAFLLAAFSAARGQSVPTSPAARTAALAPVELSALFDGGFWTRDAATLRGESRGLFRPDGDGLLRFASSPALPAATLFGIPVLEALVRFSPGGFPSGVSFAFYTRGDAGRITPDGWKELCGNVHGALTAAFAPAKGQPLSAHIGSARVRGLVWDTPSGRWTLRRGESDRPEYLTLALAPPAGSGGTGAPSSLKSTASTHTDRATQRGKVQDDGEGGKWLSVPMVDQGEKGYCAAASLERVLRFYGAEVDQHLLADLAGTDAQGGTSSLALKAAIDRTAHVFGVRRKECAVPDPLTEERARNNYDRAAKKLHLPTLPRPVQTGAGRMIDVSGVDERVLQLVRSKEKGFKQFQRDVKDAIDAGRPLMWGVTLFRDGVPAGGHMRLVVGYNEAKGVIYFSDSWGAGHEKEAMPYEEAWAITHLLFELVPKNTAMPAPGARTFVR
jgi:hypothetical protein